MLFINPVTTLVGGKLDIDAASMVRVPGNIKPMFGRVLKEGFKGLKGDDNIEGDVESIFTVKIPLEICISAQIFFLYHPSACLWRASAIMYVSIVYSFGRVGFFFVLFFKDVSLLESSSV